MYYNDTFIWAVEMYCDTSQIEFWGNYYIYNNTKGSDNRSFFSLHCHIAGVTAETLHPLIYYLLYNHLSGVGSQ